jgi:hypothetical protein
LQELETCIFCLRRACLTPSSMISTFFKRGSIMRSRRTSHYSTSNRRSSSISDHSIGTSSSQA